MRRGFTLVELIVVVTVILILLGLLIPIIFMAQRHAYATACANNLHQIGQAAVVYETENHGWVPAHQHDTMPVHWTSTLAQYLDGKWAWNQPTTNLGMKMYVCASFGTDDLSAMPNNVATNGYYVTYAIHEAASTPPPNYGGSYDYNHGALYNYYFLNVQRVSDQSQFVLFMDSDNSNWFYEARSTWATDGPGGGSMVAFRHDNGANVAYMDGHSGRLDQAAFGTAFTTTSALVAKY
jgi:prepilin-type N-terminal cleavage/methylation domain-containing protein/prepilin-type processing-associated H-X9-DG protein